MRLLLAIGCDKYDYTSPLIGAELDATRIFERLTSPAIGAYNVEHSRLVLSPNSDEIRYALRDLLLVGEPIEELTIYFAGHGCIGPASFYMASRDTRLDALSMTAFSLSDALRAVVESRAIHTNIIIDACESGGLIEDLNVILKGSLIGEAGSPGITLFAASASNEDAAESPAGGLATSTLIDCIDGKIAVRDDIPTLELVEIGRIVGNILAGAQQTPIVWGLNLHGASRFCANPLYSQHDTDLRLALTTSTTSSLSISGEAATSLWRLYYSNPEEWRSADYIGTLRAALCSIEADQERVGDLAYRFCMSTLARFASSDDALLPIRIYAGTLCALLKWMSQQSVEAVSSRLAGLLIESCRSICSQLLVDLESDEYALLHGSGGLPDLFYLPIRTLETLGWLSLSLYESESQELADSASSSQYISICRRLLDTYPGGFSAVSEAQAPSLAAIVLATEAVGARDISEEILGYLMRSSIDCRAMFADTAIDGKGAFRYIYARASDQLDESLELSSNPTELLTVILRLGQILEIDHIFDQELWSFDDRSCLAFVADSLYEFGDRTIPSGNNKIWKIGENLFRLSDLGGTWTHRSQRLKSSLERIGILCSCLALQDRVPWQLIDDLWPSIET
ncbi:caspase family protein [Montanilutibacter psychrotolerans]|nr:caspase family protein [Lysobacter psychrotolerans]